METESKKVTWHEIARPQIHGYDLQCLAMIGRFKFASGADEKVIRIFEAPKNFIKNFGQISSVDVTDDLSKAEKLPEGASVPPLGLSNKAVFKEVQVVPPENTGDDQSNTDKELQPHPNEQFSESYFRPVQLNAPPTEEVLLQNTLWPETQKLYGHGYEIFAVACNPQGTVLASACKAAKSDHASIILWDTSSWRQIGQLPSHALTVTQLTFSQSGKFLLSVSRDRTWSLFKETDSLESTAGLRFTKVAGTDKKTSVHSRIIWSCAWCRDDSYFVTSSRDKKVIIWAENNKEVPAGCPGNWQPVAVKELSDSVTAVAVYGASLTDGSYLLALGLDCGKILLLTWNTSETTEPWRVIAELDQHHAHHMTVKRLQFRRPNEGQEPEVKVVQLASCGADHLVRIYDIKVERS